MRFTLTRRCEYGMRILVHLATLGERARMTASELAEACEVPPGNVPTIVNILSRAGLLNCTPGRNGGCILARDPEDVTILEVIEVLEGPLDVGHCLLDERRCHDKDPYCALHESWAASKAAAIGTLHGITLADTARREIEIREELAQRASGSKPKRPAKAAKA